MLIAPGICPSLYETGTPSLSFLTSIILMFPSFKWSFNHSTLTNLEVLYSAVIFASAAVDFSDVTIEQATKTPSEAIVIKSKTDFDMFLIFIFFP